MLKDPAGDGGYRATLRTTWPGCTKRKSSTRRPSRKYRLATTEFPPAIRGAFALFNTASSSTSRQAGRGLASFRKPHPVPCPSGRRLQERGARFPAWYFALQRRLGGKGTPGPLPPEAPFQPAGDQPGAIAALTAGLRDGMKKQTLLGVTGSGKTFTVAHVINELNRPALILTHNKTLAAQLYREFKAFFPDNAVEYFVSYYDYYQPEAYVAASDTYIEKDSSINEEIDLMRLSTTSSLLARRDVIVVASVSCIYGLGSPGDYRDMVLSLRRGQQIDRDSVIRHLVAILYERNDADFTRSTFRVRGDVVDISPSYSKNTIRVEFFGDEIDSIKRLERCPPG
jgi:hypothetical protein